MIVTRDDENAAVWRATISIAVFKRVAGSVDAGPFSVPDSEYAIDGLQWVGFDLLRAEYRGAREFFIDRRQKLDIAFLQILLGTPEFHVVGGQRRAAVTTDKSGAIKPGGTIHSSLHQRYLDQRLRPGEKDAAGLPPVSVHQFVVVEREFGLPYRAC